MLQLICLFLLQNAFVSLGTAWGLLGSSWVSPRTPLGRFGTPLGRQRGSKEGILEGLGAPLGSLGTHLGSFSDRFETILGSFGNLFEIIWGTSGSQFFDFLEFGSRAQTLIIQTPWG